MKGTLTLAVSLALVTSLPAQGFLNLGFESAFQPTPGSGDTLPATLAFPSWQTTLIYPSGPPVTINTVYFNTHLLDSSHMGIFNSGAAGTYLGSPLFGNVSAFLLADEDQFVPQGQGAPSLAQTGLIPSSANSLWFATSVGDLLPEFNPPEHYDFLVTINGVQIPYTAMETHPNYVMWAADISSFAGNVAELRFTLDSYLSAGTPLDRGVMLALDGITFSPQSVPEPSAFVLAGIGLIGILVLRRRRR